MGGNVTKGERNPIWEKKWQISKFSFIHSAGFGPLPPFPQGQTKFREVSAHQNFRISFLKRMCYLHFMIAHI